MVIAGAARSNTEHTRRFPRTPAADDTERTRAEGGLGGRRIRGGVLITGDCLAVLPGFAESSIDAVVCDPPYHLASIHERFASASAAPPAHPVFARLTRGFMGREWDGGDVAFRTETWKQVLRVLKPGGHLVAAGGTRTYHRLACAIEDAGFEIRDSCLFAGGVTWHGTASDCAPVLGVPGVAWGFGNGLPKSLDVGKAVGRAAAPGVASKGNRDRGRASRCKPSPAKSPSTWSGWGTGLRPGFEPFVVARKPLGERTVARNVLRWGTGGLHIDAARIPRGPGDRQSYGVDGNEGTPIRAVYRSRARVAYCPNENGRWPANVVFDEGTAALVDEEVGGSLGWGRATGQGISRYFFCAKASRAERNRGLPRGEVCTHPTVKPLALMRHLITLVTPDCGIVLDPFLGSGSTAVAAVELGFRWIGIEREPEYVRLAADRIQAARRLTG